MRILSHFIVHIIYLAFVLITFVAPISHADDETSVVIVKGSAPIKGENITGAKEAAKRNALRNALEQGVGMRMDAETILSDEDLMEKIHTHSTGYIKNFSIIKEKQEPNGTYSVMIRAITKRQVLRETIDKLIKPEIIPGQMDYPRIMILPFPDKSISDLSKTAETILVQKFTDLHFDLVDPSKSEQLHQELKTMLTKDNINDIAAAIGLKHHAEIIILYGIDKGGSTFDGLMESTTATMTTRAIVTSTAQILTANNNTESGLGKTIELAQLAASKNVANTNADKLIPAIVSWWDNYVANGLPYTVTLKTPPKSDRLIIMFQQNIEAIPGVVSLSERSSGGGVTEMMVKYKGTDLKRSILTEMFKHSDFSKLNTVLSKGRFVVFSMF